MKIGDLLTADRIAVAQTAENCDAVIGRLVDLVCERGFVTKKEKLLKALTDRESEGSTGVGGGIAIPHCMTVAVKKPLVFAVTLTDKVDFDSYDGKPVDLVFMIAAPDNGDKSGMEIMSSLSLLLTDDEFADKLKKASSAEEFSDLINAAESGEKTDVPRTASSKKKTKLAAVCACPNGLVKNIQAATVLEKAAEKAGAVIKTEKRSSKASQDVLSAGDIADAKAVIIAADIDVPMDRFDGKRIVRCSTDECISAPAEFIDKALAGKESQFNAAKAKKENAGQPKKAQGFTAAAFIATILPFLTGAAVLGIMGAVLKATGNLGDLFSAFTGKGVNLAIAIIVAVIAGYVAGLVAGDEGMAVGFAGGMLLVWSHPVTAFVGAFIVALCAGGFVVLLKKTFAKVPKKLTWLVNIFLYPIIGILLEAACVCFAINPLAKAVTEIVTKL